MEILKHIKGNLTREEARKKGDPYAVLKADGTPLLTEKMTEEEFTAIRPGHIGGSGVSAILGISPWTSTTEYYDQFLNLQPKIKVNFNEDAKELGHENEEFVAQKFVSYMRRFHNIEVELLNDSRVFRNDEYPYAQVNLDRRIVKLGGKKVDMILECKTTSFRNSHSIDNYWKKGICPPYYECQVRFYLKVMNLKTAYICCCWGLTWDEMAVIKIERDDEADNAIIAACENFIDCVEQGVIPTEKNPNSELYMNYHLRLHGAPEKRKDPVELPDSIICTVQAAINLQQKITEVKEQLEAYERQYTDVLTGIIDLFEGADYGSVAEDDEDSNIRTIYGIKIEAPMKRAKFDEERFKAEQPALFEQYKKESVDTTLLGKKEKEIKAKYTLPAEVDGTKDYKFKITKKELPLQTKLTA